jgi:hypothetical protein
MTLTLDISPELERRLEEESSRKGVEPEDYVLGLLEEQLREDAENVSADHSKPNLWTLLDKLKGTIDGPPDWSSELDHYLYGTPKRNQESR